jgi:hypothetical protein
LVARATGGASEVTATIAADYVVAFASPLH